MQNPILSDPEADTPSRGPVERWAALSDNVRGGILFILSSALFSVMMALIKLAGESLHVTEILLFRQITMTAVAAPLIIAGLPGSLRSSRPGLQIARVAAAFLAMMLGFSAMIYLPIAEVTVILFSKSFFMTLLGIIFLSELVRMPRWIAVGCGFLGVIVIVWPQTNDQFSHWHLAALASAVCVALVMIMIRILAQVDKPVTILTYQAVGVGLLLIAPAIYYWKTPTAWELGLLITIGVLSAAAQYLNILAMKVGEASAMAPLEYTRLVFVTLLGLFMFGEWPDLRVWLGGAIIIGAAFYVLNRERRSEKPQPPPPVPADP